MPLKHHAKQMFRDRVGLDRELARDYLLRTGEDALTALVIYQTGNEILVFQIEPDSKTLSLLMGCHNTYAGDKSTPLPPHIVDFITSFPTRFKEGLVIDNTNYQDKYHALTRFASYVFLMGCM